MDPSLNLLSRVCACACVCVGCVFMSVCVRAHVCMRAWVHVCECACVCVFSTLILLIFYCIKQPLNIRICWNPGKDKQEGNLTITFIGF